MTSTSRRVSGAVALTLALALTAAACRDSDESSEAPEVVASPSSTAPSRPAVETVVTFGELTGRLPRPERARLANQVGGVVDGWVEAAYLGGDYPRRDFSASWPGFTAGARDLAQQDKALMSNADIGDRVDAVELRRSKVRVDVLAAEQRPVGVTARVQFIFRTTGKVKRDVLVQGRLYLTRADGGWQVFGYDVTKGAA